MSIIRNLLYNSSEYDDTYSKLIYNKNLLHNFIAQHQPRFILHCGSPENAIDLAHYIKNTETACEILHIKNWHPSTSEWLIAEGDAPNPHQKFLDKVKSLDLEDILISFDGLSETATEVLSYRNLKFDMMISDTVMNDTNYIPLISLLQKNAVHIRYIGDKKLSEVKADPIFNQDIDTSITYAKGYLIIGMDYLSLYDGNMQMSAGENSTLYSDDEIKENYQQFVNYFDQSKFSQPNTHNAKSDQKHTTQNDNHNKEEEKEGDAPPPENLTPREERLLARQQRREERRRQRQLSRENKSDNQNDSEDDSDEDNIQQQSEKPKTTEDKTEDNKNPNLELNDALASPNTPDTTYKNEEAKPVDEKKSATASLSLPAIKDDGESTISAARKALRARRAARRAARAEKD